MRRLSLDPEAVAARRRVRKRRAETNHAYDRAYARALKRLREKYNQEFDRLLAEERDRV